MGPRMRHFERWLAPHTIHYPALLCSVVTEPMPVLAALTMNKDLGISATFMEMRLEYSSSDLFCSRLVATFMLEKVGARR
jgi:hypothetical protein